MNGQQIHLLLPLISAFLAGMLIGWEREFTGVQAGVRTFIGISMGACLFGLVSSHAHGGQFDPTRISAQVVTGIGFLGAGVIFRHGNLIRGLTTAATMWSIAAIGLAFAYELYLLGIVTTVLILITLNLPRLPFWNRVVRNNRPIRDEHNDF